MVWLKLDIWMIFIDILVFENSDMVVMKNQSLRLMVNNVMMIISDWSKDQSNLKEVKFNEQI